MNEQEEKKVQDDVKNGSAEKNVKRANSKPTSTTNSRMSANVGDEHKDKNKEEHIDENNLNNHKYKPKPISEDSKTIEDKFNDQNQPINQNASNSLEEYAIVAPKAEFENVDLDSQEFDKNSELNPDGQATHEDSFDDADIPNVEIENISKKDEPDAASVFSLFMEKDFRYYFQHPYFRLVLAYFVTFCNFLIYAEDPVAHSIKESTIPVIGNDFAFIFTRYPQNAWSLLKVVFWLAGILSGMVIGKVFVHTLLFNKVWRLKMFQGDKGSWVIIFLSVVLTVFIFSHLYNAFLLIGGDSTVEYKISELIGMSNSWFMKAAACGTWCGDFFTAWMVTDIMLQEKLYPKWAVRVRAWWIDKYNRIILFWIVTLLTSFAVIFTISTDFISWDTLNHDFLPTNELSRSFLASFILVFDIMIVMQDWDFPHFLNPIDIKLPGLNTAHIEFDIPKYLKRESWHFHITGKWFNYGILFFVILLDMNMWKNQIFYQPVDYGQYTDADGRIHTVLDEYSLNTFNASLLTYSYRNNTINPATNETFISGDGVMNSRFYNFSLPVKAIAFIPNIAVFLLFGILIWVYGRFKPTKDDPYAGRLKKRKKGWRRFSDKFRFKNLRKGIRSAEPVLKHFKNRGNHKEDIEDACKEENNLENQQSINDRN